MLIEGFAQRLTQKLAGQVALYLTQMGSIRVAQTEGEGDEAQTAGFRFNMSALGATGQAPVQTIPTTAAQWLIYNPTANPVTAFLEILGTVNLSGTPGSGEVLYACPVAPANVPTTIPTMLASVLVNNSNPVSGKSSKIVVASAVTLLGTTASNWIPVATGLAKDGVVAVPPTAMGTCDARDIRGKLSIPPGCGLALAVIAPAGTTPTYAPYATWREYIADNQ